MRISAARTIVSGLLSLAVASTFAQGALREGIDYTIVQPPQSTNAAEGRVEVVEFFGYWCPACNAFEPTMRDWAGRHAVKEQVLYVPLPTHFKAGQANFQKLYYALDVMGRETAMRPKVFAAIHTERSLPDSADVNALADWVAANGIDRKQFVDTFNSFTVQSKVNRANQLASAYGVTGIPSLAVGGKYLLTVNARTIGNADALLARAEAGR
jgi:protein dithiol oxidoreductase (disulfide-forming)